MRSVCQSVNTIPPYGETVLQGIQFKGVYYPLKSFWTVLVVRKRQYPVDTRVPLPPLHKVTLSLCLPTLSIIKIEFCTFGQITRKKLSGKGPIHTSCTPLPVRGEKCAITGLPLTRNVVNYGFASFIPLSYLRGPKHRF